MQDRIRINGEDIYQPDRGLQSNFQTTYSSDSARVQNGTLHATPLFTVEQFGYTATHIPTDEARKILQHIIKGLPFTLHYYSTYYGIWRDDTFRVGQGQFSIGSLEEDGEYLESFSFNMTGDNPL